MSYFQYRDASMKYRVAATATRGCTKENTSRMRIARASLGTLIPYDMYWLAHVRFLARSDVENLPRIQEIAAPGTRRNLMVPARTPLVSRYVKKKPACTPYHDHTWGHTT